jgi:hypothetical protein
MYAGGWFHLGAFNSQDNGIAKWNGTGWESVGGGLYAGTSNPDSVVVNAMITFDAGQGPELYAGGGGFWEAAQQLVVSSAIMRWNGVTWSSLAGGLGAQGRPTGPTVLAMTVFDDGTGPALFVGGDFNTAGGIPTGPIAKWDGINWSTVGTQLDGQVRSLAVYDGGRGPELYAGGTMSAGSVLRWNGSTWSPLPSLPSAGPVVLNVFNDSGVGNSLFAGGSFSVPGSPTISHLAKWDGTKWTELGTVNNSVYSMSSYDDGSGSGPSLYVGGHFTTVGGGIPASHLARWTSCPGPIDFICSTGGARLSSTGTTDPDTLVLTSTGELPSALSIFLQGDELTPHVMTFGDGLRCTGGTLLRLYAKNATGGVVQAPQGNEPTISHRSAALGDPLQSGSIRFYQTYYRDPNMAFCPSPSGGTFNVSSGLRVIW